METRCSSWSDLYPEIISHIAGLLKLRLDLHNFRSVCRNWRSSSSCQPHHLPLLHPLLPLKLPPSHLSNHHSSDLISNAVFLIKSPSNKPYLITVEEFNPGYLRLLFPFTRNLVKNLPFHFPTNLGLFDFDLTLVATGFNIRVCDNEGFEKDSILNRLKVILLYNCVAVVLFSQGSVGWARVRRGGGDQWRFLRCLNSSRFDDIVEFKGCVYGVDRNGRVFEIRYCGDVICSPKLRVESVVSGLLFSGCDSERRKRLVVDSNGLLYLVYRGVFCGDKIHFRVFRLDEEGCKWEEIISIGKERVLFVCVDWCFFASSADIPGCRGNCIFFLKGCFPMYVNRVLSDDLFFLGASKELEVGVFHLEDGEARLVSAYPGFSDVMWPPPVWLSTKSSSFGQ